MLEPPTEEFVPAHEGTAAAPLPFALPPHVTDALRKRHSAGSRCDTLANAPKLLPRARCIPAIRLDGRQRAFDSGKQILKQIKPIRWTERFDHRFDFLAGSHNKAYSRTKPPGDDLTPRPEETAAARR